jgi:hypothetical protein
MKKNKIKSTQIEQVKLKTISELDPEPCCDGLNVRDLRQMALDWYLVLESSEVREFIEDKFELSNEEIEEGKVNVLWKVDEVE